MVTILIWEQAASVSRSDSLTPPSPLAMYDPGWYPGRTQPRSDRAVGIQILQVAVNASLDDARIVLAQLGDERVLTRWRQRTFAECGADQ